MTPPLITGAGRSGTHYKKPPRLRGAPGENVVALMELARLWEPRP